MWVEVPTPPARASWVVQPKRGRRAEVQIVVTPDPAPGSRIERSAAMYIVAQHRIKDPARFWSLSPQGPGAPTTPRGLSEQRQDQRRLSLGVGLDRRPPRLPRPARRRRCREHVLRGRRRIRGRPSRARERRASNSWFRDTRRWRKARQSPLGFAASQRAAIGGGSGSHPRSVGICTSTSRAATPTTS